MIRKPIIFSLLHTGTRFLKERLGIDEHVHASSGWQGMHEFCLYGEHTRD
jgi:hypothetical protein